MRIEGELGSATSFIMQWVKYSSSFSQLSLARVIFFLLSYHFWGNNYYDDATRFLIKDSLDHHDLINNTNRNFFVYF